MKILALTDLHQRHAAIARILGRVGPVDLVLLGGDLTDFGRPRDAEKIVAATRQTGAPVFAVAGNCDSPLIEQHLIKLGVSLFRRGVVWGELGLQGLSAMPPWRKSMYQFTEEQLAADLAEAYPQVQGARHHVVLSHPPPRGVAVDRTLRGAHVGSTALRTFIEQTHPELVLCGHIHEGRGVEQIGTTTIVNCGPAAEGCYALAEWTDRWKIDLRQV